MARRLAPVVHVSDTMTPAERYRRLRLRCRSRGLRMTPQRDALLRVLSRATHHPTADELVRGVRRAHPSVSHATIYRNVQQLAEHGVISTLERAGATQYDPNPDKHHHFVCERCGAVRDIYLVRIAYRVDGRRSPLKGAEVSGCELRLRGRCARCRAA